MIFEYPILAMTVERAYAMLPLHVKQDDNEQNKTDLAVKPITK